MRGCDLDCLLCQLTYHTDNIAGFSKVKESRWKRKKWRLSLENNNMWWSTVLWGFVFDDNGSCPLQEQGVFYATCVCVSVCTACYLNSVHLRQWHHRVQRRESPEAEYLEKEGWWVFFKIYRVQYVLIKGNMDTINTTITHICYNIKHSKWHGKKLNLH